MSLRGWAGKKCWSLPALHRRFLRPFAEVFPEGMNQSQRIQYVYVPYELRVLVRLYANENATHPPLAEDNQRPSVLLGGAVVYRIS